MQSMLFCVGSAASVTAYGNAELSKLAGDPANWSMWGGNYYGQRYSELDQINEDNVSLLQPAWTFSVGVKREYGSGPLVVGDTIYVLSPFPNKVFSINLTNHAINLYEPIQDPNVVPVCCETVDHGLAYVAAAATE